MEIVKLPTLYKRTATGAVQIWYLELQEEQYRSVSGQIDGVHTTSEWTVCTERNQGRSNYRTASQQARTQVDAIYKERLSIDYHSSIEEIDTPKIFFPMLANDYKDHKKKVTYPCLVQPKLDGMRGVTYANGMFSRNGKPILSAPHILEITSKFHSKYPHIVLDGELYNHEYKYDFDTLMSIFKKTKPTPEDLEFSKANGKFYLFDLFDRTRPNLVFTQRYELLIEILKELQSDYLVRVDTQEVLNEEHAQAIYELYLEEGYEGIMYRRDDVYHNKRSSFLIKRKEFIEEEFLLIDLLEGLGNWKGYAKRAVLQLPDGRTFGSGIRGNREITKHLLANKQYYIGKPTTVRYQALTPDGVPRFGVVKEFDRSDI